MSQDKELEIQLQFLDEAQEYLDTVEAALLGLANTGVDGQKINAALRAAHSIKGGAAMMGFQLLSHLAHRLEDSFKVLKVQKNTIAIDADLERLLLSGTDCLRRVIEDDRHHRSIDQFWLDSQVNPIFDQLHDRLGDPQAEDASSVLSPEEGQDILRLLFETEVDGCLQRLETALQNHDPCLREEVEILAQELEGLGEMLQLPSFVQLCHSITLHLVSTSVDRTEDIAQAALESWRRSQALVLTGNLDVLPDAIQVAGIVVAQAQPENQALSEVEQPAFEAFTAEFDRLSEAAALEQFDADQFVADQFDSIDPNFVDTNFVDTNFVDTNFVDLNSVDASSVEPNSSDLNLDSNLDAPNLDANIAATGEISSFSLFDGIESNSAEFANAEFDSTEFDTVEPEQAEFDRTEFDHSESGNTANITPSFANSLFSDPLSISHEIPQSEPIPQPDPEVIRLQPTATQSVSASSQTHTAEFQISNDLPASLPIEENQDNTVRVPVKHLNQMNDVMGELTIERNRLDLHLKRLRSLIRTLSLRVQVLNQSNAQLRMAYDRVETQSANSLLPLLPAAIETPATGSLASYGNGITELNNGFDALEMDQYNELHLLSQEVMETIVQIQEVTSDIELGLDDTEQINRDLYKTSKQLQTSLSHVRMRPLTDITDRFPKAIRELSLQHNKPVELKVYGGQTLVDRNILEALSDPLLHLIRNAFDHGIEDPDTRRLRGKLEQGLIEIRAFHRSNRTIITISDDGGGIPLEKVRLRAMEMGLDEALLTAASDEELLSLIFEPGFSTADRVTDLSGRGIGMDVVRNNLKQVRGEIKVSTKANVGTTYTLSVPFTLSIARVLLAESGGMLLAFPTDVIEEMTVLQPEAVNITAGNEMLNWQDTLVQLIRLSRWLRFNCPRQMDGLETPPTINGPAVLILNQGTQQVGLQIDRCWGEQEVAIRKVEGNLPLPAGFNSCTILGDGRVVPLVSVSELLHWIASADRAEVASPPSTVTNLAQLELPNFPAPALMPARKPTILVVDDSINVRRLLALTLEKAGYQVAQAKDGQDALEKLDAGLQVQAVICDIEMPRLDGYGFLSKMRSKPSFEHLPIAMLTSRSGDKHRQLAMNLGATAYFSKPYNEQLLLQTLERLIDLVPAS